MSNIHQIKPAHYQSLQRLGCQKCGTETNAACNCGVPYMPIRQRVEKYDRENPGQSTRQAAADLGVSNFTVSKARKSGVSDLTPATVTGRDGKSYPAVKPSRAQIDTTNLLIQEVSNGASDFSNHVDEWLEEHPDVSDEALGALAMAISNAADVLAELAARLNRGVQ